MRRSSHFCAVILMTLVPLSAVAQVCDPKDFTVRDFESLNFDKAISLSVIDSMSSENEQNKDSKLDVSALVKGVPVKVGVRDAKEISSFLQKNSELNFTSEEKTAWVKSAISTTAAGMYSDCLAKDQSDFSVAIPEGAYRDEAFKVVIEWHPRYPNAPSKAFAMIEVLNGTVDGQRSSRKKVGQEETVTFEVVRDDPQKTLQLVPTVDNVKYSAQNILVFPPILRPDFEIVRRTWPEAPEDFVRLESDDGGGGAGSDAKSRKVCLDSIADGEKLGAFLAGTFEISLAKRRGTPEPEVTVSALNACVTYSTYGVSTFGKGGFSAFEDLRFSVLEIVGKQ